MTYPNPTSPSPIRLSLDTPMLAEMYDRMGQRQFEHGKRLITDLEVLPGQRILDVGCGTGLLGEYVATRVGPEGRVIGIDPLPSRVAVAQRHTSGQFQVQVGRAEDLSAFPDETFDVVYCNSVFHWLEDQPQSLREAARVLRAGGRLGICTAAKERPSDLETLQIAVFGAQSPLISPSMHRVDSAGLAGLLHRAGFEPVRMEIHTFADPFADVNEVMDFQIASSFGNAFAGLDLEERARARAAIDRGLDDYRLADGTIRLKHHSIFAVARRV